MASLSLQSPLNIAVKYDDLRDNMQLENMNTFLNTAMVQSRFHFATAHTVLNKLKMAKQLIFKL